MLVLWNILHVSLVVAADLLDADVVLGLDVGLGGGVRSSQSHYTDDVLEVLLAFNFDLWGETPLISEQLIKNRGVKAGSRPLESHRIFTLVQWWDNDGSLGGNIARGGFELRHLTPIKQLCCKPETRAVGKWRSGNPAAQNITLT